MTARWGAGPEGRRIADLGDGTYRNPVLAGDFPDPSVLEDGGAVTVRGFRHRALP